MTLLVMSGSLSLQSSRSMFGVLLIGFVEMVMDMAMIIVFTYL
jgi:hypothetical protein